MNTPAQRLVARIHDSDRALVCGIVNVTPDSFSDGGEHADHGSAVEHALRLVREGADILDIGGESTKPGARRPDVEEELNRVTPVIAELVARVDVPISVDTSRPEVMRAAIAAGAAMVNDVRGLRVPGAVEVVAEEHVVVCVSHMQGEPDTMQTLPSYRDVVDDVRSYLSGQVAACVSAGIPAEAIVLDPGFGFGKTLAHNWDLFAAMPDLCAVGQPLMVGVSRKSMIGGVTGKPVEDRLAASVTAAVLAVEHGARIVRVHDVAATVDGLAILDAARGSSGRMSRSARDKDRMSV